LKGALRYRENPRFIASECGTASLYRIAVPIVTASSCLLLSHRRAYRCTTSSHRIVVLHRRTASSYCIVIPHCHTASHIMQYLCYISHHIIGPCCVSYVTLHIAWYIVLHIMPCSIICNTQIRVYTYYIRFLCVTK